MEELLKLRQKAKDLHDKYHTDLGRLMAIEQSQAQPIEGIKKEFKTRRKEYRILSRQILELQSSLNADYDSDVEIGTDGFINPFK